MTKSKKESQKKKARFQGSIRAEDRETFHKQITTKIASWNYKGLYGTFSERCLTTKLIELFQKLEVKHQVDDNPEPGSAMVDAIPGVDECCIEQDGRAHIRIRFEGNTQSHFDHRRKQILKYLNANDIPSEDYCLFICVTGHKQQELSDKYLKDMEMLKKIE